MALDVGSIIARLGGRLEPDAFDRFDRRVDQSRRKAEKPVEQKLKADVDGTGFDAFGREVEGAERKARTGIRARLGAVLERGGFDDYDRAITQARAKAAKDVKANLGAEVDKRGFEAYFRALEQAKAKASRRDSAKAKLGADFDEDAFKAFEKAVVAAGGAAGGAGGNIGGLTARFGGLSGSLGVVTPLLATAIPIITALGGVAIALASSMAAAAAGVAAVGIGAAAALGPLAALGGAVTVRFGLVQKAYAALSAEQDKGAQVATSSAKAQRGAADAIAAAQQNVGDARRQGAEQVKAAEVSLADARRTGAQAVAQAETALADARREGTRDVAQAEAALKDARTTGAQAVAQADTALAQARVAGAEDVKRAEDALASTRAQGAASVKAADASLADAQRDARLAQESLTDARGRARRELEDLSNSADRARLSEEGAGLALEEALKRLQEVQASPRTTSLELREAQYAVKQAREGVKEAATARQRADQDAAKGTQTVTAARDRLQDANSRVIQAEKDLAKATADAARANVAAQEDVRKAQHDASAQRVAAEKELRDTRRDAAEATSDAAARVADAQQKAARSTQRAGQAVALAQAEAARSTTRAQQAVAKAEADAARSTSRAVAAVAAAQRSAADASDAQASSASAAEAALGKLSKAEKRALESFQGFSKRLSSTFQPATDAIFNAAARAMDNLGPVIARYKGRFTDLGESVGSIVDRAARSLAGPEWTKAIDAFFTTAQRIVDPLANAVGSVIDAARNIAVAAQPFVVEFADNVESFFSKLAGGTKDTEHVRDVIGQLVDSARSLGHLFASVGRLLVTVFGGGKKEGDSLVDSLTRATDKLNAFLQTKEGRRELQDFLDSSVSLVKNLVRVIGILVAAAIKFTTVLGNVTDFLDRHRAALVLVAVAAAGLVAAFTGPIATVAAIGAAFVIAYKNSDTFRTVVDYMAKAVEKSVGRMGDKILGAFTQIAGAASTLLSGLGHVPGFGWADAAAKKIDKARDSLDSMRVSLRNLGKDAKPTDVSVGVLAGTVDDLKERLKRLKKGSDDYNDTAKALRIAQGQLNDKLRDAKPAGERARGGALRAAGGFDSAAGAADNAGRLIASSYNSLAEQFGTKSVTYKATVKAVQAGAAASPGRAFGPAPGDPPGFATGGIPNPGSGSRDDHVLMDPSGRPVAALSGTEGILNAPQMGIVDQALQIAQAVGGMPYGGLDDLWGSGMRHYATGGILGRANQLDRMHLPYVWGGHHGDRGPIRDPRPGLDCSSAVSFVLGIPPRVSGGLETIGKPGKGRVTIYANATHTFMSINGRGFGTSGENPGGGPGWLSYNSRPGFVVRHVDGDLGGTGDVAQPKIQGRGRMRDFLQKGSNRLSKAASLKLDRDLAKLDNSVGNQEVGTAAGADANVVQAFQRASTSSRATPKEKLGLFEAGIVESGLRNLQTMDDHDSLGALQERVSIYGRNHALDPFASATRFIREAKGFQPFNGSAGQLAAAVQRPAAQYRGRYDQVAGQARRYLARGGPLRGLAGSLPRFAGGGKLKAGKRKKVQALAPAGNDTGFRVFKGETFQVPRTDRSAAFSSLLGDVDDLETKYGLQDRRYNLSTEELIDENGAVDTAAVAKRAGELQKLLALRQRIVARLEAARTMAASIIASYQKKIRDLKRSLKHAKKKKRSGVRALISTYTERLGEWDASRRELTLSTIPGARLDVEDLQGEIAGVKGTTAETAPADTSSPLGDLGDLNAAPATDPGVPADPTVTADPGTTTTAPDPAEVAALALAAVGAFQSARAELFSGFGSNVATGPLDAVGQAAGTRYFGAAQSGDGVLEGAGAGGFGGQAAAGSAASGPTVINNFSAPPPDPHSWSQGITFELANV